MLDKKYLYFVKVVEKGSFTSAAKELYLTQPALSKQMTLLENELEVKLFDRSGYRPLLTRQGKYLYDEIKRLMEDIREIKDNIPKINHDEIRVGITGAYENRELMSALNVIKNKYQDIDFAFNKSNFNGSLDNLINREVDFSVGIESTFKNISNIKYNILHDYQMCIICAFNHPLAKLNHITMEEIKNEDFIVLSKKFGKGFYQKFMDSFKMDKIKPHIKKEVNSFDELVFSVSIGEGIAIVSKNVVRQSEVKVIDLLNSHHSSNYVIAYHDENDEKILNVIKDITEYFKQYN